MTAHPRRRLRRWNWGQHPRSPWRDPRALLGSLLVHAVLIALVSWLSWTVVHSQVPVSGRTGPVFAEIEPPEIPSLDHAGEGGGAPGALGQNPANQTENVGDSVTSGMAPSGRVSLAGQGGGGGTGGGSGGGTGGGTGTAFEVAETQARSYAYVIDCSGSMGQPGSLEWAKQELVLSLARLPQEARLAVIFYNAESRMLSQGLEPATPEAVARIELQLPTIKADGSTRPRPALEAALALSPEVVFLLTDGQDLNFADVERIQSLTAGARIHTIELGGRSFSGQAGERALEHLARVTGGKYRHIDLQSAANDKPGR